jgi:MFS family permease
VNPRHKLALLAALYFSQGLPYGLFSQALPAWMREQGRSLTEIGLANLLALPWALKFAWAPAFDRVRGTRAILVLQALAAALLAGIAFLDPTALPMLMAAVFLCNLVAATQDIATDGLAVRLLSFGERGLGNGVQVAGYRLGMVVGGGALLVAFDALGWTWTFLVAAALLGVVTVPVTWARGSLAEAEAPSTLPPPPAIDAMPHAWFRRPGALRWLLVLVIFKLGDALGTAMVRPLLVDHGLSVGEIGALLGTLGSVAGLAGALFGGWAAGRIGRRRALAIFGAGQALALGLWAVASVLGRAWFLPAVAFEHLVSGMGTATLFAAMMDACRREASSTDYTVQACVVVIATGLAATGSGILCDAVGYAAHLWISAVLCALVVPVVIAHRAPRPFQLSPG